MSSIKNSLLIKRLARLFIFGFFGLVMFFLPTQTAFAVADPDYISIHEASVFRNVLETGDQLFIVRYDVSYSVEPIEDASVTYLMDICTSGGISTGYSRSLNYYQHNIVSIYLTPAQALTWEGSYSIKILGNPSLFSPLVESINMETLTLSSGKYFEASFLADFILAQAALIEDDWVVALLASDGLLNSTGAFVFEKAIPNLNNMVPSVYQITTSNPSIGDSNMTTSGGANLTGHIGPDLNAAMNDLANWWGSSASWMKIGSTGLIAGVLGSIAFGASKGRTDVAIVFASMALPIAVWIGLFEVELWIMLVIILSIIFGIIFIQGRFS